MTTHREGLGLVKPMSRPVSELDDLELLRACADRDEQAVAAFVRRFQGDVVRFISRLLGPRDGAIEDMTQLTFVAALDASHRFRGTASVKTWLLGIAYNKVRVEIRSRGRRRAAMKQFSGLSVIRQKSQAPEAQTLELRRRLEGALMSLDPARRATFVLCEAEGMTARQAAQVLGTSEGTVWRRLSEARKRLRRCLIEEGVER